jgi:hypothetical protein
VSGRLWPGLGGAGLAVLLAAFPTLDQRASVAPLLVLAIPAVVLYAAAVLRLWPRALPLGLALLAVEYLLSLYLREASLDLLAPAYACGLFLSAELGWLALESFPGQQPWGARGLAAAVFAGGGLLLGGALIAVALLPVQEGWPLTLAGGLAAVVSAGVLAWLARLSTATHTSGGSPSSSRERQF